MKWAAAGLLAFTLLPVSGATGYAVGTSFVFKGIRHEVRIPCDEVAKTPQWEEADANPPLSMRSAMEIAVKEFQDESGLGREWSIHQVRLQAGCWPRQWYYTIEFAREGKAVEGRFPVIVLMDGRAALPKPREEGER